MRNLSLNIFAYTVYVYIENYKKKIVYVLEVYAIESVYASCLWYMNFCATKRWFFQRQNTHSKLKGKKLKKKPEDSWLCYTVKKKKSSFWKALDALGHHHTCMTQADRAPSCEEWEYNANLINPYR